MDVINNTNIEGRAYNFSLILRNASIAYRNNHTLFMMLGDDFAYTNAEQTYQNFEKLMDYINGNISIFNISIKYSTPVQYFQKIREENKEKDSEYIKDIKKGDFLPYQNQKYKYWTGYYSTRSSLKHMIRQAGRFLQVIRTLFGLETWNGDCQDQSIFVKTIDGLEKLVALC